MPKQPQDRKPKQQPDAYVFRIDGKTYSIPTGKVAEDAAAKLPGRFLRDAFMDAENGQVRLGFAMLELVADEETQEALYSLPAPEMMEHVEAWMKHKAAEEDASLGESSASSD